MPDVIRWAATRAVEPPTEPAVWTRNMGLPTAPRAGARYSSGIMLPSNMSGALPMTTASMSRPGEVGVGQGHLGRLADQAGDGHVLPLGLVVGLAHADDCATLCHHAPSRTQTRFCCRHGPEVAWATARSAWPEAMRAAASPMRIRPADMSGLAASAPPDGLMVTAVVEPEGLAQDDLLVGEGGVQLGHVHRAVGHPGHLGRLGRRRRRGEVAGPERVGLHPVVEAGDPHRAAPTSPGLVAGGQHDGGRPVGDRRQRVPTQRARPRSRPPAAVDRDVVGHLGLGVAQGVPAAAGGDGGEVGLGALAGVDQGPGLEGGQADRVRPQRGQVVGVELQGQDLVEIAQGRSAEA